MATTKDRAKAGRMAWKVGATTGPDERGDFIYHHGGGEFFTEAEAIAEAERLARKYPGAYAEIRRGTYEAEDYDDHRYGHVYDACWAEDEDWFMDGWLEGEEVKWDRS